LQRQDYDLLLTPTIPITAFAAGVDTSDIARSLNGSIGRR
jgi:Asp-tRNA(Asn)/Glu-tRNA(Gln) amidotransferase A subunit family amidase